MKAGLIHFITIIVVLCTAVAPHVRAQVQPAPAAIEISGSADVYYSRNFARPASARNELRNFDIAENQFVLDLVEVVLQKKAEPVGFRADLDYGPANDIVQPAGTGSLSQVQQAFLTAVIPVGGGLTVDAGKFVTFMGSEVIESKDNWNYSRSLLFAWAIPYYHTGVRLSYPVAERLTACVHIVNGWNGGSGQADFKTLGATLNWAASARTQIVANAIDGFEHLTPIENGKRTVVDVTVTQKMGDAFTLALNAAYGQARTDLGLALWKGAALYARYAMNEKAAVALRGEIFDDPQGYATGLNVPRADVKELTGTCEYLFSKSLLLRGELRRDLSNVPAFDKAAPGTERSQTTALLAAVVLF